MSTSFTKELKPTQDNPFSLIRLAKIQKFDNMHFFLDLLKMRQTHMLSRIISYYYYSAATHSSL